MSDRQDILRRIIQNDVGHMGPGYQPNLPANPSYREDRYDRFPNDQPLPTGLAQEPRSPRPPSTADAGTQFMRDMEGLLGPHRSITGREPPTPREPRAARQDNITPFTPVYEDSQVYNEASNPRANPLRALFGDAAIDAIPSRRGAEPPPPPGAVVAGGQAGLTDGFQVEPGALPGFTSTSGEYGIQPGALPGSPGAARGDLSTGSPAERAQAGLQAAMQGQSPDVDTMAPEQFDPETGTRTEEARKLGLLERMFGEKGSPEHRAAGRALMMAGAAIMSTDGDLGKALGNGIQAGLMQYDDVLEALREEEMEARQMGMAEEAHAMNMHLKSIQAARAAAGGKRGSLSAEPELTKVQQAAVLADEFSQLGLDPQMSLAGALNRVYGVPATLVRPPSNDPMAALLGGE